MWTSSGWRGLGELKRLGIVLQVSTALSGMSPLPGPWRGYEAGTGSLVHKPGGWKIRLLPLSPRGRGVRGEGEGTVLGMTSPPHPRPLSPKGRGEKEGSHGAFLTCLSNQVSISYRVCSTDSRAE